MAPTPYATRDWSHRAAYRKPPGDAVGGDPARVLPRSSRRPRRRRRAVGRRSVLRAVPGLLRPLHRQALDPDGDLPADDVPALPLPPGLRGAVPRGHRLVGLAAVLPHPPGRGGAASDDVDEDHVALRRDRGG